MHHFNIKTVVDDKDTGKWSKCLFFVFVLKTWIWELLYIPHICYLILCHRLLASLFILF